MVWNKTGSKFGFHCDYEVLMVEAVAEKMCLHTFGFSGFLFQDFSSGKTTQVPLNRADAPMSNWQLGMAPGWLCFQLV